MPLDPELISTAIAISAGGTALLALLESLRKACPWQERGARIGSHLSILAIGAQAGIYVNSRSLGHFHAMTTVATIQVVGFIVLIGLAGITTRIRQAGRPTGAQSLLAVGIGGAALSIPFSVAAVFR